MSYNGGKKVERYREKSKYSKENLGWMAVSIVALAVWLGYEIYQTLNHRFSLMGYGYIIMFIGLLIWRFAYRYTYILTDDEMVIISEGLGMTRTLRIDLAKTESYTNRYVRRFFRQTKIGQYFHRYSSGDSMPTRLLVFSEGGKLKGVIFKASDQFIEELKKIMPKKFLDMKE